MKRKHDNGFPSRDAIVAFIRANPGKIGTREIAREFGLKNADRAELKRILRELADEGTVAKRGRKIHETALLPPVPTALEALFEELRAMRLVQDEILGLLKERLAGSAIPPAGDESMGLDDAASAPVSAVRSRRRARYESCWRSPGTSFP